MSNYRTPKRDMDKYLKKEEPKKKSALGTLIKYSFVTLTAFLLAAYIVFYLYINSLPPIRNLGEFKPNIVTKIYSADGEVIKTFTGFKSRNVEFENIPENIKNAVIATEDKKFYTHKGYDPFGLARSIIMNLLEGHVVQGASTITQQLARILFLNNEKTYNRKIKELIIAARIEKSVSKDKILEMYLNNIYLGSSSYGIGAASEVYFGKKLSDLSLAESALIAGLPQAPSVYSPFNKPELAIKRRNHVLNRMYKMGYITEEQLNQAKHEKLRLNKNPEINFYHRAGYFVDFVMKELESLGFSEQEISQGGYKIRTTLNYKAQNVAENSVLKNLAAWGLQQKQQQAAVFSVNPNTGEIYVYVGGKNYAESQYDRVQFAVRPPGSSFKPFVYAAAIEKGYDPNEVVSDTPLTQKIGGWLPKNYGNKYRGKIPLYKGVTYSSNVVAVRLIDDIGVRPVVNICNSLGITTPLEHDLTIALGSNGAKLYEMVVAYGAFANDGFKITPYAVEQIETSRGQIIYKAARKHSLKVLDSRTATILTAMMETVIKNGTGRAADIGKIAAGKTGTTDNNKDAWFIGYTPNVVTGVWVGKDDNSNMAVSLTGGTVPAIIWKDVMKTATENFGNAKFPYPEVELKSNGIKSHKEISDYDNYDDSDTDSTDNSGYNSHTNKHHRNTNSKTTEQAAVVTDNQRNSDAEQEDIEPLEPVQHGVAPVPRKNVLPQVNEKTENYNYNNTPTAPPVRDVVLPAPTPAMSQQ